jgi:membrane-associated phospholipid phosphatase
MKRNTFLILLILPLVVHGQSDSTWTKIYKTKPQLEIPITSAFFIGSFFAFKALDKHASFTEADVMRLNTNNINSFDRPIAFYNPAEFQFAQDMSYNVMDIALVSPAFLLLDKKIRHDWQDFISLFLVAHAIDNSLYFGSVLAFPRARPLTFNPDVPLSEKIGEGKNNSFFSGHTAWAATSTFFAAKIYTDYHHIKGAKRILIYTGAAIPPAIVAYYRLEAGKHFRSDVITAFIVGAACGIGVPELHRIRNRPSALSLKPFSLYGANGVTLNYKIN